MVTTRSRKRVSGGDVTAARNTAIVIDSEPSDLPPKAKRLRTAATEADPSNAARTRRGRALKPVATNANANSKAVAPPTNAVQKQGQTKTRGGAGFGSGAFCFGANSEPEPSSSSMISTTAVVPPSTGDQTAASKAINNRRGKKNARTLEPVQEQVTSFTRATRAGDKTHGVHPEAVGSSATNDANGVTKSASTTSLDSRSGPGLGAPPANGTTATTSYQNGIPDDIDARDAHDPLSVTDYVEDMYEHFRAKEGTCSIDVMYMGRASEGKQPNITESMRCILVDWLIEVHYKFKLFPETLYLTVNILDRFLAQTKDLVVKRDLQLVGVTSLLVSAKYEEMYVPELRDLTYICDGAYTEDKILRMEENILKTLNYNVTVPTPHTFLIRFLKAAHADKLMAQLACFLLDGTLLTLENLTCVWRPSQLAAAAILLARRQLGRHNWSPTLVNYSLYREEDVLPVARALLRNKRRLERNPDLMALAKKYSKTKYGKVSHISFLPLEYEEPPPSEDSSVDDSEAHEAW